MVDRSKDAVEFFVEKVYVMLIRSLRARIRSVIFQNVYHVLKAHYSTDRGTT